MKFNNIFLISNMYPKDQSDATGVFVKNFQKHLEQEGVVFPVMSVIKGSHKSKIMKLVIYFRFYLDCIFKGFTRKFDIIYAHYLSHTILPIYFLNLFIKKPIFINIHGTDVKSSAPLNRFSFHLFRLMIRKNSITGIICPSQMFRNFIAEKFRFPMEKIVVSPSGGIDLKFFNRSAQHPSTELLPKDHFKIGYYGRLDKKKGLEIFLEGLALILRRQPNAHGVILSNNTTNSSLTSLVARYHLKDHLTIHQYSERIEIPAWIAKFDVFIFPTLLEESLGLVALEAMACGTPVIASNIVSIKEYIKENHNGALFKAGNSQGLANKMIDFCNLDSFERAKLAENAYKTSLKFSGETTAKNLIHDLQQLLDKPETQTSILEK